MLVNCLAKHNSILAFQKIQCEALEHAKKIMHVNSCAFLFPKRFLKNCLCTGEKTKITDLATKGSCSQGATIEKIASSLLNKTIRQMEAPFNIMYHKYQADSIVGP